MDDGEEEEDQEVHEEDQEDMYVPDDDEYENEENSFDSNDDMSEEDVHGLARIDELEKPIMDISSGEDEGRPAHAEGTNWARTRVPTKYLFCSCYLYLVERRGDAVPRPRSCPQPAPDMNLSSSMPALYVHRYPVG